MKNKTVLVLLILAVAIVVVYALAQADFKVCEQFLSAVHDGISEAYFGYGLYMNNP